MFNAYERLEQRVAALEAQVGSSNLPMPGESLFRGNPPSIRLLLLLILNHLKLRWEYPAQSGTLKPQK